MDWALWQGVVIRGKVFCEKLYIQTYNLKMTLWQWTCKSKYIIFKIIFKILFFSNNGGASCHSLYNFLMCPSYYVFKTFLQIILLFNFPSIIHNLATVKLLIISFFLQGTLTIKSNKNEIRTLKVTSFFSHRKSNFCEKVKS